MPQILLRSRFQRDHLLREEDKHRRVFIRWQ